ncbi:MAG: hypothetical protein A3G49_03175 [Candidatus Sungbacteria bacterium RIFCSPLOWO2_12_FULL_41_11]|uniref:Uncharacterized protein n=1 Tax=Candidatus Sungbacteria bacterium RIFCSPLOWO2_12_FULL_41_11 TaxID=1802286 RepID=A0A1G2LRU0_9BACT|nr:MAG: hypothetical protein A3G49_03175 [Candidatus Sungbacteria bacterium RIFCSPLOWO2_12_FULL_41_11]
MKIFKHITIFLILILSAVLLVQISYAKNTCPTKTQGECVVVEATAQTASPYLALSYSGYLDNLYQYLLGLVGIAALGAMVYGGVLYIVAAGNPSKLGEAKGWISNAIYGLLLAAFSYVLLYTINPDLVKGFTNLDLSKYLKP